MGGDHFYTINQDETNGIGLWDREGYEYEGIECYVYESYDNGDEPPPMPDVVKSVEAQNKLSELEEILYGENNNDDKNDNVQSSMPMGTDRNPWNKMTYTPYAITAAIVASVMIFMAITICFVNWKRIKTLN